jgi:hypothetical protein
MKAAVAVAALAGCALQASALKNCWQHESNDNADCKFLTELYESMDGDAWTNNTNWNTATSYWYVVCARMR